MASSILESDELVENPCCVCVRKGKITDADFYCMNRADYYCTACLDVHAMLPSTDGHKILGKGDFKSTFGSDLGKLPALPTQRCSNHSSKILDIYCEDHDEVICAMCVLEHRSCRNVKSVPDNIDNQYTRSNVKDTEKNLKSLKAKLVDQKTCKELQVADLKRSVDEINNEIQELRKKLQTLLENAEHQTVADLEKVFRKTEASIVAEIKDLKSLIGSVDKIEAELKRTKGNKVQEFVCIKTFEKLSAQGQHIKGTQKSLQTISFTTDRNIEKHFRKMKVLGNVSSTSSTDSEATTVEFGLETINRTHSTPSTAQPTTKHSLYTVKQQRAISVKLPNDTSDKAITGSCITDDGYLLLADAVNKRLKRLDLRKEKISDFIDVKGNPWAVCLTGKTEAAVSSTLKYIHFVSVQKTMTVTRTIRLNHRSWGIAYYNGDLFISDSDNSVYVHDMEGQELRKISTDTSGKTIFQDTRHIAICGAENRVYVADRYNGLVTVDLEGNHLSTLSTMNMSLSEAWGVCTNDNSLFLCDSGNVVQIRKDNTLMGQVAQVDGAHSMCFNPHTKSLYVTCYGNVSVLELG